MSKVLAVLLLCLIAYGYGSVRESVAATIFDEFDVELEVTLDNTKTHQLISVSDSFNAAKNVQTIKYTKDGKEVTKVFTTVAFFDSQKIFMMSDDSKTCHERPIGTKLELVQLFRRVFQDPTLSPVKELEDQHMFQFTVNWNMIESMDDWTHVYFDSSSFALKKIEQMTEKHEEPWITFSVVSPIKKASHPREYFTIKGCYESVQDEVKAIVE
uniref:Uncharacterized protein n=1 Tax=Euplotes harpa TaxID=151035 RepID=A0A7S3J5N6_9SPIT|mmetsp:Transcript_21570/g.24802  ORF Transcript_21570/g.24802 Transcript_21570/m.24802 type:complete len:213 (+) Transcript_21570:19-657(+)